MFRTRLPFLAYAISVCLSVFLLGDCKANGLTRDDKTSQSSLVAYLNHMGDKLDCYFTIEYYREMVSQEPLLGVTSVSNKEVTSIASLIELLKSQLPQALVFQDKENPTVIRIKSKALSGIVDYVLEQKETTRFKGPLGLIFANLNQKHGAIRFPRSVSTNQSFADFLTKVSYSSKGRSIRSILTECLPLSRYSRILWAARTLRYDDQVETWLSHSGPMQISSLIREIHESSLPFSQGIYAYAKNSDSDQLVTDALSFIDERMKSGQSLNVRWAMLYLGKHKVERGIPTLLKYVDYQYTTTPLIEEAFPALRALVQIGAPASNAALANMATEKDARRLRLLLRVVLGVNGLQVGQKAVAAALPSIRNTAQRQKVAAALKLVVAQIPNDATASVPEAEPIADTPAS